MCNIYVRDTCFETGRDRGRERLMYIARQVEGERERGGERDRVRMIQKTRKHMGSGRERLRDRPME